MNTKKIQGRKGVGNMPFVFFSNGSLSLSDPDGTLRMGSIETLRWNRIGAFERYLKAEEEKERAARGNIVDDEDEDAEGELDPDMVYPLSMHSYWLADLLHSRLRRYHSTRCRPPHSLSLQIRSRHFLPNRRHVDVSITNGNDF